MLHLSWVSGIFVALGFLPTRLQILFSLICSRQIYLSLTLQSSGLVAQLPWATRYMQAGLLAITPRQTREHFLRELVVMACKNWAGFSVDSWVPGSPCTSQPMENEHDLHKSCFSCTESLGRRCQISTMPISWGSSGFTPQAPVSSMRTAKAGCLFPQFGSAAGGTLWNAPCSSPLPSLCWWYWQCSDSSAPAAPGTPQSGCHSWSQRIFHPKEYYWQTSAKQERTAETITFNYCMDYWQLQDSPKANLWGCVQKGNGSIESPASEGRTDCLPYLSTVLVEHQPVGEP